MSTISSKSCNNYALDSVNVSLLGDNSSLPLVISPRWDSTLIFLCSFMETNRKWLEKMMVAHGAILIRGFDIEDGRDFERAVRSYQPVLNSTYKGTSPRNIIPNTSQVFSAAEVPVNYPIAQHLEMSFLNAPPRELYFGCLQESKSKGGETSLCCFKKVYRDLPSNLKRKLLHKKLKYTRTQRRVGNPNTHDVSDQKGWPEIFGTTNMEEISRRCEREGESVTWGKDDLFVSTWTSEPFQLHPVTKEPVWFNHSQVFHWSTFPAELFHTFQRTWDLRFLIRSVFISAICLIKYAILRQKMSLDITFGDGESISLKEMTQIRKAVHDNMVFNRWKKGDIVMIDNFAVSHGRQPTYDKGRKVVVCWSDPMVKPNEFRSERVSKTAEDQQRSLSPKSISDNDKDNSLFAEQRTFTDVDLDVLTCTETCDTLTEDDIQRMMKLRKDSKCIEDISESMSRDLPVSDPSFWKKVD